MPRRITKPYAALGKLIDSLARRKDVRGPKRIKEYVEEKTGEQTVSEEAIRGYLYGDYVPRRKFGRQFAEAFELSEEEKRELAYRLYFG